jgi:RNA polymerase sigma-70 factor (ECF subfamily)
MPDESSFESQVLPHVAAGYNFARWMLRDPHAAEDALHDAVLRALKYFSGMHGENPRAWFLSITRRCCLDTLARRRSATVDAGSFEEAFDPDEQTSDGAGPEELAILQDRATSLMAAIESLPPVYREVIVLRELDELSYKEIAHIADIPIGTVMSRLARARLLLQRSTLLDEVRSPACSTRP